MTINCFSCVYGNYVLKQRYILCLMAFVGLIVEYALRGCLNIAITEMVKPPEHVYHTGECPDISSHIEMQATAYEWSTDEVAAVLSAFFPGYVITHIPGGFLADAYGGKHVMGIGAVLSAILSMLTPLTIEYGGSSLLCWNRFVMGLAQGPLFPSLTTLLSKWVPKSERSSLGAMVLTGSSVGSILCNLLSGLLISTWRSWKIVFYFWAVLALIWYIFFMILCTSAPSQHPYITDAEKEELADLNLTRRLPVPWTKLLCYKPTIALTVGQIGHVVLFLFMVVNLPKYFKDVLKFNIKENGLISSLPYVSIWISGSLSGVVADWLYNKNYFSMTVIRKIFSSIGTIVPSALVVVAGYCGCNRNWAAGTFILAMFCKGPVYSSLRVNPLDLTQNFAGIMTALVNGAGCLFYCPVPYIIAFVAPNNLLAEWMIVYWMLFLFTFFTSIVFDIWGSAERAEWDKI